MGDDLNHTTVTGGVVVVAETGHIMRNTLQKHLLYKFPVNEDRITSGRVIVNTLWAERPNNTWYAADILTSTDTQMHSQTHECLVDTNMNMKSYVNQAAITVELL